MPAIIFGMGAVEPAPAYDLPLEGEGEAAVYVLSRDSGEGNDRKPQAGDVLLTDSEVRDIKALASRFERFLLVLNVGGVVDLTPVGTCPTSSCSPSSVRSPVTSSPTSSWARSTPPAACPRPGPPGQLSRRR